MEGSTGMESLDTEKNAVGWNRGNFRPPIPTPGAVEPPRAIMPQAPTPFINLHVADPPRYATDRYELYRKELLWWRDIHHGISDQLTGMIALKSDGMVKKHLAQYMEQTRTQLGARSMQNLLVVMGRELERTSQETSIAEIGVWSSFGRREDESARMYLIRWQ